MSYSLSNIPPVTLDDVKRHHTVRDMIRDLNFENFSSYCTKLRVTQKSVTCTVTFIVSIKVVTYLLNCSIGNFLKG